MMESQRSDLASWLQDLDSRVALQHPVVKHTWHVLMTVCSNPEIPRGLKRVVEDCVADSVSSPVRISLHGSIQGCLSRQSWQELDDDL